jgi:hypothetical protein
VKKKATKPSVELGQARKKLKALTSRKKHYSLDTDFGVLTVEDGRQKPAAHPPEPNRKSGR